MSSTTGSAASQLDTSATSASTVHSLYIIANTEQYLMPLDEMTALCNQLQTADIFTKDEMSIMAQHLFSRVFARLKEVNCMEFLLITLVLLAKDHHQLPPVSMSTWMKAAIAIGATSAAQSSGTMLGSSTMSGSDCRVSEECKQSSWVKAPQSCAHTMLMWTTTTKSCWSGGCSGPHQRCMCTTS